MPYVLLKPLHKGIFYAGFPILDVEMTEQMNAKSSVHFAKCTEKL